MLERSKFKSGHSSHYASISKVDIRLRVVHICFLSLQAVAFDEKVTHVLTGWRTTRVQQYTLIHIENWFQIHFSESLFTSQRVQCQTGIDVKCTNSYKYTNASISVAREAITIFLQLAKFSELGEAAKDEKSIQGGEVNSTEP